MKGHHLLPSCSPTRYRSSFVLCGNRKSNEKIIQETQPAGRQSDFSEGHAGLSRRIAKRSILDLSTNFQYSKGTKKKGEKKLDEDRVSRRRVAILSAQNSRETSLLARQLRHSLARRAPRIFAFAFACVSRSVPLRQQRRRTKKKKKTKKRDRENSQSTPSSLLSAKRSRVYRSAGRLSRGRARSPRKHALSRLAASLYSESREKSRHRRGVPTFSATARYRKQ